LQLNAAIIKPSHHRPTRSVAWRSTSIVKFQRQRLADAGLDPREVADGEFRFMRIAEVKHRLGVSTSSVYRFVSAGLLEPPVPLGPRAKK
jgi:predicted DNA-binding transcriptional regulator AlpA